MKILKFVGLGLFLTLLSFILFYGDVFAKDLSDGATSHTVSFNEFRKKWDYKDSFERQGGTYYFSTLIKNLTDFEYPVNGAFAPVLVRSNKNNNFYQWTNLLIFRVHQNLLQTCDKGVCELSGRFFIRDSDFKQSDFELLKDANVYFGTSEPDLSLGSSYYKCELKNVRTDIVDFTCNVPVGTSAYGYLRVELVNQPFKDYVTTEEYREDLLYLGVSNSVNRKCLAFNLPELSVSVNQGTVTINVTNMNIFENDSEFSMFQVRADDGREIGFELSRSSTYVYENVPNGDYTFSISACKPGPECGPRAYINYSVTSSNAPTPNLKISDDSKKINLDASESFSYDGTDLAKYYFKIKIAGSDVDSEWVESSSPYYTFEDQEYGMYHVHFKVEDMYGNTSREVITSFSHRSPTDKFIIKITDFIDSIQSGISNLASNIGSFLLHIFIPEKSDLQNSIDSLQNTLNSKLGFLGESVSFILEEVEYMLVDPGSFTSICLPQTSMPEEMSGMEIIPEGEACLTATIMSNFSIVTSVIKIITSLLLLGWFTNYCYNELMKILGGVT